MSSLPHPVIVTSHVNTMDNSELLMSPTGQEEVSIGKLNQYFLLKDIGYGAYGRVALCRNELNGRYYACKMISKSRLKRKFRWKVDNDGVSMIRREIAILKKVSAHIHINSLIEVLDDEDEDMIYMIFELCEYGPVMSLKLSDSVNPIEEDVARDYFRDIICGIDYMHKLHIVHRDIKPENLLIKSCLTRPTGEFLFEDDKFNFDDFATPMRHSNSGTKQIIDEYSKMRAYYLRRRAKGYIQIADFGISEMFEDNKSAEKDSNGNAPLKLSGGGINTSPLFMAPEHCRGDKESSELDGYKTDIWALGVTLYSLVHGYPPFKSTDILPLMDEIMESIPEIDPSLSQDLQYLLRRMLEKDPEQRITIKEILQCNWVTESWWHIPSIFGNSEGIELNPEDIRNAYGKGKLKLQVSKIFQKFMRKFNSNSNSSSTSSIPMLPPPPSQSVIAAAAGVIASLEQEQPLKTNLANNIMADSQETVNFEL